MFRIASIAKSVGLALVMAISVSLAQPAQAESGRIQIKITKAGFVVGVSGGSGTLFYKGKSYPLSVSGLKVGLTIGVASAEFVGPVSNLRRAGDISGTYTSATGSAALGGGVSSVVLENQKGVKISLRGRQKGIEASLDVGGITIRLK